jgi:PST family polysaccharide transporter
MLSKKTIIGAGWLVSSRLGGRLIDFATVLVLAKTLTPTDFGLTALASTLIAIVDTILEVPLLQALTRLKYVEKSHLDTAFTLGLLRGLLLSLIVLSAAWPFSYFLHDSRLFALVTTLALGPVARSVYSPSMVYFTHKMSFREIFIAEFTGKVFASVISITVMLLGGGYWAIIAASISSSIVTTIISYAFAPYRPALSLANVSDFSGFIGWFGCSQIVSAISWQLDRIMLGYYISKSDLGRYTMASDLATLPSQSIIGPAMQTAMAAFSKINDDPARLAGAYLKASRFTLMLAVPACIGMSLTSDLIFDVLFGAKWKGADVYLKWLSLTTICYVYYQPVYALALSTNNTKAVFKVTLIDLLSKLIFVPIFLFYFSTNGVVAARVVVSVVIYVVSSLMAHEISGVSFVAELKSVWKTAVACAVMICSVVFLRRYLNELHLISFLELVVTAAGGATVYIGALFALGVRLTKF